MGNLWKAAGERVSEEDRTLAGVTFFDVGQGDGIAIRSGNRTIVVDGGRDLHLLPLLADRGVRRVDAVVLSHAHPDHCGSKTSTSQTLLDLVAPRIAVISCGRRNLFGHPHPSILEALGERRIRTWRTDRDGTVDVEVRTTRLYVRARRD